ncbi:MAG: lysylphosphatidylglycerol synthase transmembrane domain-containing protein [Planctomycetota bacterium]
MSDTPNPKLAPAQRGRVRWLGLLRLVAGLAILAWVVTGLNWRDRLVLGDGAGATWSVPGTIEGDWKSDTIRFRVAADAATPSDAPPELAALDAGTALGVQRRAADDVAGWTWEPSMQRVFRQLEGGNLALAMLCFLGGLAFVTLRWMRLLALAGCRTGFLGTLRLSLLGLFFNQVMPGVTGGDLVKGVLAAREHPGRRADAAVSVIVDRLFGLLALATLGTVVVLASGDAFAPLRVPLIALLVVGALGATAYTSRLLREGLGIKRLVARLPLADTLRSIDRAALLYLRHPFELGTALMLSVTNHLVVILGCVFLGRAIGVPVTDVGWSDYFVIVPVANIVSALPLAPGGWGVGEWVYKFLFEMRGASGALGVALSLVFRLSQLVFGLVGGIYLLVPGARAELGTLEERPAA